MFETLKRNCDFNSRNFVNYNPFIINSAITFKAGEYDARDVERLQSDDVYAGQFLKKYTVNGDVDKACDLVETVFKFRSEWKVNGNY